MLRTIRTAFVATAATAIAMTAASLSAQAGKVDLNTATETTPAAQTETTPVTQGFPAGAQDFVIVNESYYDIYYIFVSPDTSDTWGDDILGAESILPAGYELDVAVDGFDSHCIFDIQVVSEIGETLEFWGVDLCSVSEVVVQ